MVLPNFLIKRIPKQENIRQVRRLINDCHIHTVCESAKCPNIGECFSRNTLTFMILGNICTRNCAFCGVEKGKPLPPDPKEPQRIAQAAKKLGLNYVVITSPARDDLPDGGAFQFAAVIRELSVVSCQLLVVSCRLSVEVLIPDFQGNEQALKTVLDANPYVLNHNVETVPTLYPKIRPQADYKRSLRILKQAKAVKKDIYTKSGFMVGLGETREEVISSLWDLKSVDCSMATIGQYLPSSKLHLPAERYVLPQEFEEYKRIGEEIGLKVKAGPFIRSSYQAHEAI